MEPLPLIGYVPKKVVQRPDFLKSSSVTHIRSVSNCISTAPDRWVDHWKHNELWVYSTEADALSVIPDAERDAFELHAYRILPVVFDTGERKPLKLSVLKIQPLPSSYESVGFDAVSRCNSSTFECSPLSCNSMAQEIETNEHCLLPDLATAEDVALRFSREEPEPGPYYVVEVLRRT